MKSLLDRIAGHRPTRPVAVETPPEAPPAIIVERHPFCLADLSRDEMRDLITDLNGRADTLGCVVFGGDSPHDRAAVIFAGNVERFHMLAAARHLRCRVVYVQDVKSGWYQGSDLLPDLEAFCTSFLVPELSGVPTLFFGQSSGGYAALVASSYVAGSTVVACAPQTYADAADKARVHFVGIRALSVPDDVIDVRQQLSDQDDKTASRNVVIAASELGNPATAHYWMDYLHALRLATLPEMALSIVHADTHVLVHGRVDLFAGLLRDLVANVDAPAARRTEIVHRFLGATFGRETS